MQNIQWVVRKAFEEMLPPSVAWRQKNNLVMVGYGWIDTLKATVAVEISDEQLANAKYKLYKRSSKEEYYYRSIFS
jgi:asparagine synthase (glutamine-hydrolysing)